MVSRKLLYSIIFAGIALRLVLLFHYLPEQRFFYDDDSVGYLQIADNVRLGNGFSWLPIPPYLPDGFRTPGYPFFLLVHKVIFGSYLPALVTQILMNAAIAYLIFKIGKEFFENEKNGLVAMTLFLFMPFSVMVSITFLTQTLFTFALMSAVYSWLKFLKTYESKYFYFSVVLLPICALIRPIAFLILVPLFASLLVFKYLSGKNFPLRKIFKQMVIAVVIFLAIILPWLIRNYKVFKSFSLSTITYYQLYFYDTSYIYSKDKNISVQEATKILQDDVTQKTGQISNHEFARDFKYSSILKERIIHYVAQMPRTTVITRVELLFKFFVRDGIRYWIHFYNKSTAGSLMIPVIAERLSLFIILIGFVASLYFGIQRRSEHDQKYLNTIFFIIAYFALLTGVMASAGLRFPVEPLILLLAVNGIAELNKKFLHG